MVEKCVFFEIKVLIDPNALNGPWIYDNTGVDREPSRGADRDSFLKDCYGIDADAHEFGRPVNRAARGVGPRLSANVRANIRGNKGLEVEPRLSPIHI